LAAGVENARPHAAARFGIADGHGVAMINGQVAEESILAVAGVHAGVDNRRRGRIDLRPAYAVDRTAAGVAGDRADAPGEAVAVFEVLRAEVVALNGAAATLRYVQRHPGRHPGISRQVHRADF